VGRCGPWGSWWGRGGVVVGRCGLWWSLWAVAGVRFGGRCRRRPFRTFVVAGRLLFFVVGRFWVSFVSGDGRWRSLWAVGVIVGFGGRCGPWQLFGLGSLSSCVVR
jgi:hypothetical protein